MNGGFMKQNIRLIITDLDGTLSNNNKEITDLTKTVIKKVRAKGILFGIATGRTLYAVEEMNKNWGITDLVDVMLGMNGAQYFDRDGFRETTGLLAGKYMIEIMERIQDSEAAYGVFDNVDRTLYADRWNEAVQGVADSNHFKLVVLDLKEWVKDRTYEKLFLAASPEHMNELKVYCADKNTENYRGFHTGRRLYEFMNPEVSKSYGIQKVCVHHKINMNEVMSIGDHNNDIEMIRDAGIGVSMGNGSDQAKEVAKYIIGTNDEEGWAKFVSEYFEL